MTGWILIMFLLNAADGGTTIYSLKFKSAAGCQAALSRLPLLNDPLTTRGLFTRGLFAVCVEDK